MEHETNPLQPALTITELNNRLRRMERLFASTVLGGMASFVATLAFLHGHAPNVAPKPATPPEPTDATFASLICRNITVVDDNGIPRVEIDTKADGPSRIRMRDSLRRERYRMVADDAEQTSMEILDSGGSKRLVLASLPEGVSGFDLLDKNGTTRMTMIIDEDNDCGLALADGNGLERITHGVPAGGNPISSWRDDAGEMRVVATVQDTYGGILDLNDADRKTRVRTFSRNDGTGGTVVFDAEQRHRIAMECNSEGISAVRWWDQLKRLRLVGGTMESDVMMPVFDVLEMDDEKPSWATPSGQR
jgi:hypothetical protein